ncbi:hypothetical protein [Microvirga rosea]|uniref:hypothetical protein n=1 Tax=Microvirga rosea TaxID=2715425 RepID=UPI001D0A0C52|nr:hypothetical protein [Microvirga rosea]MCB8823513.1 hypothetical protein [Microvirga rosea]
MLVFVWYTSAAAAATIAGRASVMDDDTTEIRGQRIRLHGIDAQESSQTCKDAGADYLCVRQGRLRLPTRSARLSFPAPRETGTAMDAR